MTRSKVLSTPLKRFLIAAAALALTLAIALFLFSGRDRGAGDTGQTLVFAVGDAADGQPPAAELGAYIRRRQPDRFFYLGDVYETGTLAEFRDHYEPLYGALGDRTDPVIGNHEYPNREEGYYPYWGEKRGWTREQAKHRAYIDSASGWQVIAYSSETHIEEEAQWVARQLESHRGTCRIALAHKGRYAVADEKHTGNDDQTAIWDVMAGKVAINLVAHNHLYGRLAPIDGVRVIVSGAGGHGLRQPGRQEQPVHATVVGVATATELVLRRGAADIRQVDATGKVYDRASIPCTPLERAS